uniref:Uncharacterized protein n=1 Tax=Anopheles coluzzii TaxID=1518534 RepID=A0A8W7P1R8_ANOCL
MSSTVSSTTEGSSLAAVCSSSTLVVQVSTIGVGCRRTRKPAEFLARNLRSFVGGCTFFSPCPTLTRPLSPFSILGSPPDAPLPPAQISSSSSTTTGTPSICSVSSYAPATIGVQTKPYLFLPKSFAVKISVVAVVVVLALLTLAAYRRSSSNE